MSSQNKKTECFVNRNKYNWNTTSKSDRKVWVFLNYNIIAGKFYRYCEILCWFYSFVHRCTYKIKTIFFALLSSFSQTHCRGRNLPKMLYFSYWWTYPILYLWCYSFQPKPSLHLKCQPTEGKCSLLEIMENNVVFKILNSILKFCLGVHMSKYLDLANAITVISRP